MGPMDAESDTYGWRALQSDLRKWGEQGYELVAVVESGHELVGFMKRPR